MRVPALAMIAQFSTVLPGCQSESARAVRPPLLPREREVSLAMSAGPPHLTREATIYALERTGFVKVREGTNGFTCLVVRDHPEDLAPVCHDPEGTRVVVPRLLREAELRAQGKTETEVRAEINEELRTGKLGTPQRVGIAYMLSGQARAYVPRLKQAVTLRPQVRFYAPYLRSEDIGARPSAPDAAFDYPEVISDGQFDASIAINVPDRDTPAPSFTPDPALDALRQEAARPGLLPRDREMALAESAGPPYIARAASVLVLDRAGFVKVREGSNGFACLVERGWVPGTLYPTCFDPEGVETLLPPILRTAALRAQGKSRDEVERDLAARFQNGEFRAPRRVGIAYMLSTEGRFETPNGGLSGWAPHYMIYAPYVRDEDVGALPEGQMVRRLPTVIYNGPHSYLVVTARRHGSGGTGR